MNGVVETEAQNVINNYMAKQEDLEFKTLQ